MNSLSTVEAELPPGFRFHPRDEELICDYLMKWVTGCKYQSPLLIEVDLNKCEPWDIPETACVGGKEWYFYSQRDRKYATGFRKNRATVSGYWKATGKDRPVIRKRILVGMRKTLVFYQGRAPKGQKTEWVMHEFRLEGPGAKTIVKEDWALCRVIYKNISELLKGKKEPGSETCSLSLPALMEPYLVFDPTQYQASSHDHQYHEQVPCFSNIFYQNQTIPVFMDHPEIYPTINTKMMPNNFGGLSPDLGSYDNLQSVDRQSSSDKMVIKAVLDQLTKSETGNNDLLNYSMKGSPSFGEGSSDSYLSEAELSSLWNL